MSDQQTNTRPPPPPRPEKYLVFNETDGILVHPGPVTRSSAERLVRQFRGRFREQGFYLNSRRERMNPQDVRLSVTPADGEHPCEMEPVEGEERGMSEKQTTTHAPTAPPDDVSFAEPTHIDANSEWEQYRFHKAQSLTARGYAVYYPTNRPHSFHVVRRWPGLVGWTEYRADVTFLREPSECGMGCGRISTLKIWMVHQFQVGPFRKNRTLFEFRQGLVADDLNRNRQARKMFADLIAELN